MNLNHCFEDLSIIEQTYISGGTVSVGPMAPEGLNEIPLIYGTEND